VTPAARIVRMAHDHGARVLIDGAQAVPHLPVDVQGLGCDFYAFSGHKLYGPTGIGVLYGKREVLDRLPPYRVGGGMIRSVTLDRAVYADPPYRFEAGTPNIAGAIGLGAAVDYLDSVGRQAAAAYESRLLSVATATLGGVPGVRLIGRAQHKAPIVSFVCDDIHAHDVSTILDSEDVMVRAGHHCAQPLMERLGVPATTRVSLAIYNTEEEIALLGRGLRKVKEMFR
jgi:cysteine desulfurase/selenocysteine lyase